jgi:uncharacterized membrane protein YkvA (DUF1232 family)
MAGIMASLGQRAQALKRDVYALYFACRDPRTPWYAKALAVVVVAYAFSPIDLIPDFVPVLGYLDDLVLIPLGVLAVRAMVPTDVMDAGREKAARLQSRPRSWAGAFVIVALWIALAAAGTFWVVSWWRQGR